MYILRRCWWYQPFFTNQYSYVSAYIVLKTRLHWNHVWCGSCGGITNCNAATICEGLLPSTLTHLIWWTITRIGIKWHGKILLANNYLSTRERTHWGTVDLAEALWPVGGQGLPRVSSALSPLPFHLEQVVFEISPCLERLVLLPEPHSLIPLLSSCHIHQQCWFSNPSSEMSKTEKESSVCETFKVYQNG